ncbi:MAG: hypothetical protein R2882_16315, partial [Gemmatimonadales bacterium]
ATPAPLAEIVTRALAKDPAHRFQSAAEMADALGLVEAAETLERATPTGSMRRITPVTPVPVAPAPRGSTPLWLKRLLVGGGAVAAVVIVTLAFVRNTPPPPAAPRPGEIAAGAGEPSFLASIGVRPLDAIGDDSVTGTASAGIAEEISAQLSKIRQLRVISRTTMEAVDSKGWTSRQAADSLGVRFLLEGSVQRSGQEIGVTLQLIDAASDAHVWSETFRQPFQDILMTRQAIARKVVEALAGEVRGLALANADVESRVAEAIQARAHAADLANPVSEERLAGAIASYEHAMELDPNYAAAAAELSDALRYYVTLGFRARRDPFEALRQSLRWAETAVRLDPNLARAYASRGAARLSTGLRPDLALADIERAVTLAPADGGVRVFRGIALARIGRYPEAVAELEAATALDPLSAATRGGGLALTQLAARQYSQAA